jgi:hypothetical protein
MLTNNSDAERGSKALGEPEPIQITKLIQQTGSKLAGLAGVSYSKQDQFLTQVSRALMQWLCDVLQSGNVDPSVRDQLLREAWRKHAALDKQIRRSARRGAEDLREDFRRIKDVQRRLYHPAPRARGPWPGPVVSQRSASSPRPELACFWT